jgi:hypothetical protein
MTNQLRDPEIKKVLIDSQHPIAPAHTTFHGVPKNVVISINMSNLA